MDKIQSALLLAFILLVGNGLFLWKAGFFDERSKQPEFVSCDASVEDDCLSVWNKTDEPLYLQFTSDGIAIGHEQYGVLLEIREAGHYEISPEYLKRFINP